MGELRYDVFLCHASEDKSGVRRFAEQLRSAGLRVWFDEEQLYGGADPHELIRRALPQCRHLAIWITQTWLDKRGWIKWEVQHFHNEIANGSRRMIPVLHVPWDGGDLGPYLTAQIAVTPEVTGPARLWKVWCGVQGCPPETRRQWTARGLALMGSSGPTDPTAPVRRDTLAAELQGTHPDLLHTAFELSGLCADDDPFGHLARLKREDPALAEAILGRLRSLIAPTPQPSPLPPVDPPPPHPPEPPATSPPTAPMTPWVRYWRTRLDRTLPWQTLRHDVRNVDRDQIYLVVGEASQEPKLLVRRFEAALPSISHPRTAVISVPYPHPDYATTDARGVQQLIIGELCEHPSFPDLTPGRTHNATLRRATEQAPLVLCLGTPLRRVTDRDLTALDDFMAHLDAFVGPAPGRYAVRLVVVIEGATRDAPYRRLLRAMRRCSVDLTAFDKLHFPPWTEVHAQLHEEQQFAGLTRRQLEEVEDAYREAMDHAPDLTHLANRLLTALDRVREDR